MELVLAVVSAILAPLLVFGLTALRRRRRERSRVGSASGFEPVAFRVALTKETSLVPVGPGPRRVVLPVETLAGLPVSRPALEGFMRKRRYENRVARRAAARRVAVSDCSACDDSRRQGLNYCAGCRRRLPPFLSKTAEAAP